ncbi:MAG TPA: DUF885 domain-containing protein [Thermoanaerobaculia bacterium]
MRRAGTLRLFSLALAVALPLGAASDGGWIERSNANTKVLLDIQAKYGPEGAARIGIDGYDEAVSQFPLDLNETIVADTNAALATLRSRLAAETDPNVRQDLEILIQAGEDNNKGIAIGEKYDLPYFDMHGAVFGGLRALLDDRIPAERRQAAVVRLRKYTGIEPGYTPLTEQAMAYTRKALGNPALIGPFVDNLAKDFGNAPRYLEGIAKLFEKYQLEGWQQPYETLEKQLADYQAFLRAEVEPRATKDFRRPAEAYQFALEQRGIDWSVAELTGRAKASFREIQNEMQVLAALIAKERGLSSTDYRDVIRELKKEQLVGDAILPFYEKRIEELEAIIAANGIVTLPDRKMRIRLASEAESAQIPAPNMSPPRLIGNTGELGEFVLPLRVPAEAGAKEIGFDDFTFDAAGWTLTAHEGRPGHELQFAAIIEKGVSQARVLYAFNSVNVEGWALYAEAETKPYEPLEGQLVALQHRLLRAARAVLDPGLQLGEISRDEAFRVLEHDVVLSHAMALQEVERYTFWAPGQAPSYFCGYQHLLELRTDVERMLGETFDRQAYHDFLLAQGLLPPDLLRKAVMQQFVAPIQAQSPAATE